ncbi:hypothetical protein VPG91_29095, partial [Nitrospirillum amazonense]|uniref:hypothetical protein n=1 Tax=Nitrospirillum amazonense TaxID=28077 RepID=UPI002DD433C4
MMQCSDASHTRDGNSIPSVCLAAQERRDVQRAVFTRGAAQAGFLMHGRLLAGGRLRGRGVLLRRLRVLDLRRVLLRGVVRSGGVLPR